MYLNQISSIVSMGNTVKMALNKNHIQFIISAIHINHKSTSIQHMLKTKLIIKVDF